MGEPLSTIPGRILLVEDDAPQRAALAGLLRGAGFAVASVEGRHALHVLKRGWPFHLVVCNLRCRKINAKNLLLHARKRGIPALATSPSYTQDEARDACRLGAQSVWALPVDEALFLETVSRITAWSVAARETPDERIVLLVDDNDATRSIMRRTLEAASYRVLEASDGFTGIQIASRTTVDLVVLDIIMPALNGLSACEVLKAHCATAHVPVLMCTALSGEQDQLQAIAAAADDYLCKPFRPEELVDHVARLIGAPQHEAPPV